MKRKQQHNSIHGALILLVATAAAKIIGALFKIPLGSIIGGTGMGYYMSAYELYVPIYTIAMAGLPIAVSKLVSAAVSAGRYRDAKSYFRVSKRAFLITGLVGFLLIELIAYPFSMYISKDLGSVYSIMVIAPSMLFCCIMACYRGYYEGLRNMYPTGISQVIEALGKLVFGYTLAYAIIQIGEREYAATGRVFGQIITGDAHTALLPYAAAGAVGGVMLGTLLGAAYMFIRYKVGGDGISKQELLAAPPPAGDMQSFKILVAFALPVVLGALAQNIAGLIDLATVQRQLVSAVDGSALAVRQTHGAALIELESGGIPTFLYGCYKGFAYSFYNLVPTVTTVIGVSVLPNLAAAWSERDSNAVRVNIESVLRMTAVLAVPIGFGLTALSEPILTMFYYHRPEEIAVASRLLVWLGPAGVAAGLAMPITSMLQAIDRQMVPVINLLVGVTVKLLLNALLIRIPEINIMGAAYSTLACYAVVLLLNVIALYKYSKIPPRIWKTLLNPITAAAVCAAAARGVYTLLCGNFADDSRAAISLFVAISITAGGIIYLIMLILLKTIDKNDIKLLPKGEKLAFILEKLKVIG